MIIGAIILGLLGGGAAAAASKRKASSPPVSPTPTPAMVNQNTAAKVALKAALLAAPLPSGVKPEAAALMASGPAQMAAAVAQSTALVASSFTTAPAPTTPSVPAAAATGTILKSTVQVPLVTVDPAAAQRAYLAQRAQAAAQQAAAQQAAAQAAAQQAAAWAAQQAASGAAKAAKDAAVLANAAAVQTQHDDPTTYAQRLQADTAAYVNQVVANQPGLSPPAAAALRARALLGFAQQGEIGACGPTRPAALCAVARAYTARRRAEAQTADAVAVAAKDAIAAAAIAAAKAFQQKALEEMQAKFYANSPTVVPRAVIDAMKVAYDVTLAGKYGSSPNSVGALYSARQRAYDTMIARLNFEFGPGPRAPVVAAWVNAVNQWYNAMIAEQRNLGPLSPIPSRLLVPWPAPTALSGLAGLFSPQGQRNATKRRLLGRR